jgi:hypothetical protein
MTEIMKNVAIDPNLVWQLDVRAGTTVGSVQAKDAGHHRGEAAANETTSRAG